MPSFPPPRRAVAVLSGTGCLFSFMHSIWGLQEEDGKPQAVLPLHAAAEQAAATPSRADPAAASAPVSATEDGAATPPPAAAALPAAAAPSAAAALSAAAAPQLPKLEDVMRPRVVRLPSPPSSGGGEDGSGSASSSGHDRCVVLHQVLAVL